jgi:hypothetical protein
MLSDRDLEVRLARYRVAGPAPALRTAIVARAPEGTDSLSWGWWWGPVAAGAVVALWLGITVARVEEPDDAVRAAEVAFIAELLGADEEAAGYAELLVPPLPLDDPLKAVMEGRWREM